MLDSEHGLALESKHRLDSSSTLRPESTMREMMEAVWKLPRDLVSHGYDETLEALSSHVPMRVHEFPSGSDCWGWPIPDRWTCHEAFVETLDGERILTYEECPLHVASYSQPVDRVVDRKELLEHLYTHPILPDATPYHYLFYKSDWGICCPQYVANSLTDERYRVVIRTEFTPDSLKVGEVVVPGRSQRCVIFSAHIDHPYQVNDGLVGAAIGIEVMRRLMNRKDLHYTYRLLLGAENVGSAAYLSRHEELIPHMCGGVFLEMLGLDQPLFLQHSQQPDSLFDRVCVEALRDVDPNLRTGDFLKVVTNDERQFNAPGVRVPMISLSRVEMPFLEGPVFPQYHSHLDDLSLLSPERLEHACEAILNIVEHWEHTPVPYARFRGEPFLSGRGIHYDFTSNADMSQALFEIMFLIDGQCSIQEIADQVGVEVGQVENILETFQEKELIDLLGYRRPAASM